MQNKHQFFFLVLGVPTFDEGGGGSTWLGQNPKFFQKFDLKAPLMLDIKWRTHQGRLLMLIATEPKFANRPKGSIWQRDLQMLSAVPHIASSEYCGNIYATQIAPILLNFGQCRAFYSRHGLLSGFVWQLSGATTRL